MPSDPLDETPKAAPNPVVTECVEEALAPYKGLVCPELLVGFVETLDLFLTTHPDVAPVVEQLRPREVPFTSGNRDRSAAPAATPVAEAPKPTGTEGR
jgi:hypothetical protein